MKMQASNIGKQPFFKDFRLQYKEHEFSKSDRLVFKYPALHLHNFLLCFFICKNKKFPVGFLWVIKLYTHVSSVIPCQNIGGTQ